MGLERPKPTDSMEEARALIEKKETIESELGSYISILKSNQCDMSTPLVDPNGFPRADIDIYAVRGARVRIIELRNDLKDVIDAVAKALERVYDPALASKPNSADPVSKDLGPFAKVDGVAPGSPAAEAGLQRGDLIVKFGHLNQTSFTSSSLQPLAELVAENENRNITIRILRSEKSNFLTLTPRKGWGGRGMLGCHILPYSEPSAQSKQ